MGCSRCSDGNRPRDREGICHCCIWGERNGDGVISCTISGRPIVEHVRMYRPCPKNKFAPGSKWGGLAFLWRVALWVLDPRHPAIGSWSGCGCWMPLKRVLSRAQGAIHAHRRLSEQSQ